jgi:CBS domain-containing protein
MRTRDLMTSPVHVTSPHDSVESAAALLTGASVTALPVVDAKGCLVGMVSEGDLLKLRVPEDPTAHLWRHLNADPQRRPGTVAEVMTHRPLTTTPDADVAEVAETMLKHDVRSLPVLEGREVVGIISRRDILRAMVRGDDVLAKEVQYRLDEYAEGGRRWSVVVDGGVATVAGGFRSDTERTVVMVLARTVPGVSAVTLRGTTAL